LGDSIPVGRPERLMTGVRRAQLKRLAMRGLNATEAAAMVGCSPGTARSVYADPEFRKEVLAKVNGAFSESDEKFVFKRRGWTERFDEQADKAFNLLSELMESETVATGDRTRIAIQFLDRTPATERGQHVEHRVKIDAEQLAVAAEVASEIASLRPRRVVNFPKSNQAALDASIERAERSESAVDHRAGEGGQRRDGAA
jgi:hypothetical protein